MDENSILKVLNRFNYLSVKQMNAESKQSQISKKLLYYLS